MGVKMRIDCRCGSDGVAGSIADVKKFPVRAGTFLSIYYCFMNLLTLTPSLVSKRYDISG